MPAHPRHRQRSSRSIVATRWVDLAVTLVLFVGLAFVVVLGIALSGCVREEADDCRVRGQAEAPDMGLRCSGGEGTR